MLTVLHVLFAALASFRLVDMLLRDRIAEPIRKRLGKYYLFGCPKCLSVWSGGLSTAALAFVPWLNWPLALSWLYIAVQETRAHYLKPSVQYVRYTPPKTVPQRLQDQIGELSIQNAVLRATYEDLSEQLQRTVS